MPTIYITKETYDELIRLGEDPGHFAEEAIKEKLETLKKATGYNTAKAKS